MMQATIIDKDHVEEFYKKVQDLPQYCTEEDKKRFKRNLYTSLAVFEFPFGLVRITDLFPGYSVQAHGVFWNKDIFKGLDMLVDCITTTMSMFMVDIVEIAVPTESRSLARLMARLPFKKVATLQDFFFNDILKENADLYRCTREDLANG